MNRLIAKLLLLGVFLCTVSGFWIFPFLNFPMFAFSRHADSVTRIRLDYSDGRSSVLSRANGIGVNEMEIKKWEFARQYLRRQHYQQGSYRYSNYKARRRKKDDLQWLRALGYVLKRKFPRLSTITLERVPVFIDHATKRPRLDEKNARIIHAESL